jgi:ketosteroid isomerase-like protein
MFAIAVAVAGVLLLSSAVAAQGTGHEAHHSQASAEIVAWFAKYDEAFTARDLERLATMYHPDVTVYEGGGINTGWADYRDRHLGPELKSFNNLKFAHANVNANMVGADAAYVTADYSLARTVNDREVKSGGLATYILIRQNGRWVIRHSHTSSRRVPAGGMDWN